MLLHGICVDVVLDVQWNPESCCKKHAALRLLCHKRPQRPVHARKAALPFPNTPNAQGLKVSKADLLWAIWSARISRRHSYFQMQSGSPNLVRAVSTPKKWAAQQPHENTTSTNKKYVCIYMYVCMYVHNTYIYTPFGLNMAIH